MITACSNIKTKLCLFEGVDLFSCDIQAAFGLNMPICEANQKQGNSDHRMKAFLFLTSG